jgi:hypothetical protein
VPAYTVNEDAVRHAKRLIDARRYVLRSRWQDVQPRAREQNAFLKAHSWEEYAAWHLGLTEGAADETKARHAFVYGDFRRLHRMGLIACHYRAAEWRHKEIELAAHELLQYLDRASASPRRGAASSVTGRGAPSSAELAKYCWAPPACREEADLFRPHDERGAYADAR